MCELCERVKQIYNSVNIYLCKCTVWIWSILKRSEIKRIRTSRCRSEKPWSSNHNELCTDDSSQGILSLLSKAIWFSVHISTWLHLFSFWFCPLQRKKISENRDSTQQQPPPHTPSLFFGYFFNTRTPVFCVSFVNNNHHL